MGFSTCTDGRQHLFHDQKKSKLQPRFTKGRIRGSTHLAIGRKRRRGELRQDHVQPWLASRIHRWRKESKATCQVRATPCWQCGDCSRTIACVCVCVLAGEQISVGLAAGAAAVSPLTCCCCKPVGLARTSGGALHLWKLSISGT